MKTSNLWGILLFALCLTHSSYAKKIALNPELTCEQKTAMILPYVDDFKTYPTATINEMIEYLAPCVTAEDMGAIYATGVLTLYRNTSLDDFQKEQDAIALLQKAVDANYKPAILKLGVLYLTGAFNKLKNTGVNLQAVTLFKKMITLNYKPEIANYALGYMEMKGMFKGNKKGRYFAARTYFNQSNTPMAKHWLAIMEYHGFGGNLDPQNALQSLADNNILNSKTLLADLTANNSEWIPISSKEDSFLRNGVRGAKPFDRNKLNRTFEGKFVEYDWEWRRNKVKRYEPFTIKFNVINSSSIGYELNINGKTVTGYGRLSFNKITFFGSLAIPLKKLYKDHPSQEEVIYKIEEITLKETEINGEPIWVIRRPRIWMADLDWQEAVYNVGLLLRPAATTAAQATVSNRQSLSGTQKDNADFAVISPNPITDQFTITYNFNAPTEVKVEIYDLYGTKKIDIPMQKTNGIGHKTLPIDSSNLPKGIYLVQMTVNGVAYSKTISKN